MFKWLFGDKREPVKVFINSGKDGKWRWEIEDRKGNSMAVSPVQGYSDRFHAGAAAKRLENISLVNIKRGA